MQDNEHLFNSVQNYTKFKLVEMLIEKHKGKKIESLNAIEQMADDVLTTLAVCGLKYHNELRGEFDESKTKKGS